MCILIGIGGNPSIHLTSKFSVSNDVYVIKLKDDKNKELLQFIFYYLKTNINLISSSFIGSTIKHSSKERLSKIKLKIPKDKNIIKDIELLFIEIEKLQLEIIESETLYKKLIKELSEEALPINKHIDNKTNELSKNSNNIIIETSEKKLKSNKNKLKSNVI